MHLNFSKSGISTSIGVKGASLNFKASGTRLNTNVLGFSNSYKISGSSSQKTVPPSYPTPQPSYTELSDNIFSADLHEITSQNMAGIKESILMAQQQKVELQTDLRKMKTALSYSKTKKIASYLFIYGLINKSIVPKLNEDINAQKEAIKETKLVINNSAVNIDVQFDDPTKKKFDRLYNAFNDLSSSQRIWDITSVAWSVVLFQQDRAQGRT